MSRFLDNPDKVLVSIASATALAGVFLYNRYRASRKVSLDPDVIRPPHVRSFLPYIGSALEMGAGVTQFIRKRSQQFRDTPIFTATILGDKCVFVADAEYVTTVFKPKYQKKLDALSLQKDFSKAVLTYEKEDVDEGFSDANNKIAGKQFHHFLFKAQELELSIGKAQESFLRLLPQLTSDGQHWTQHPLFDLVVTSVVKATLGPLLSDHLDNEALLPDFRAFDKGIIALFNNAPDLLTKGARNARSVLMKEVMSSEFWNQASPWMKARREAFGSKPFFLKANLGILWASVGNSAPAIFWTLLLLIEHPEAFKACQAQVDHVIANRNSQTNIFTLEELDQLTYLESALTEALRLYQGNFTPRLVVDDFVLETNAQKYFIEKGSKIMTWWGILHSDPDVFESPEEFRFDRFVDTTKSDFSFKSGKTLTHDPVIPFGGGEHLCPGRKFISYEARLFLAHLLRNFDMRMAEGESRPGVDLAMMGIGVTHPDRDPVAEIRPRVL